MLFMGKGLQFLAAAHDVFDKVLASGQDMTFLPRETRYRGRFRLRARSPHSDH